MAGQQSAPAPTSTVPPAPIGPTYTAAAGTRTNTLAIVSLVAGIASFFGHIIPGLGGFTIALIAVITGYLARKQIRETGEKGMGIATAGMVIGAAHMVLIVLLVVGLLFLALVLGVTLIGTAR